MLSTSSLTEDMEDAKLMLYLILTKKNLHLPFYFNHLYSASLRSIKLWEHWQKEKEI